MIGWVHIFMLILFVGWGGFFVFCLARFRRSRNPVANYTGVKSHASNYSELGVIAMLAVLFAVQGGFVAFFLYLRRRAKRIADIELDTEWSELQRSPRTS